MTPPPPLPPTGILVSIPATTAGLFPEPGQVHILFDEREYPSADIPLGTCELRASLFSSEGRGTSAPVRYPEDDEVSRQKAVASVVAQAVRVLLPLTAPPVEVPAASAGDLIRDLDLPISHSEALLVATADTANPRILRFMTESGYECPLPERFTNLGKPSNLLRSLLLAQESDPPASPVSA